MTKRRALLVAAIVGALAATVALASMALGGTADEKSRDSASDKPLGGPAETALPKPGDPIPTVKPPSPEPSSGIAGDQPEPNKPGAGPRPCPTDAQVVSVYRDHLKGLGVAAGEYRLGKRSGCADGWVGATLTEAGGQPFVVVIGPNIGGKPMAVVADGTDRDKGEPCSVAQRSAAPEPVLAFCRSVG